MQTNQVLQFTNFRMKILQEDLEEAILSDVFKKLTQCFAKKLNVSHCQIQVSKISAS